MNDDVEFALRAAEHSEDWTVPVLAAEVRRLRAELEQVRGATVIVQCDAPEHDEQKRLAAAEAVVREAQALHLDWTRTGDYLTGMRKLGAALDELARVTFGEER